ncbi:Endothelin-converting enzyme 2 [Quaeritorhiza haematococci]|nr:Endothelin-converting enzyme 2 [Quaeritorhiza haematococci]
MEQILNQTSDRLGNEVDQRIFTKVRNYYDSCLDAQTIKSRGFAPIIPYANKLRDLCLNEGQPPSLLSIVSQLHLDGVWSVFRVVYTKVEGYSVDDLRLQIYPAPAMDVDVATIKTVLRTFAENGALELDPYQGFDLDTVSLWVQNFEQQMVKFVQLINTFKQTPLEGVDPSSQFLTIDELSKLTGLDWRKEYASPLGLDGIEGVFLYGARDPWIQLFKDLSHQDPSHLYFYCIWRLGVSHFNKLPKEYWTLWSKELWPKEMKSLMDDPEDQSEVFQNNCVQEIGVHLNYLAGHLFIQYAFNDTQKEAATKMINGLFSAMERKLQTSTWMDDATKQAAIKKLHSIVTVIGYSDWLKDANKVEAYYASLEFDPKSYFENAVKSQVFVEFQPSRVQIGRPIVREEMFFGYPWQLNAFHLTDYVQIQINSGILQRPLFSAKNRDSMNYGSLGVIIGHEITHAFDSIGYLLNEKGEQKPWWSDAATKAFAEGSMCFQEEYGNLEVTLESGERAHVDGALTLPENIADNGGLDIALDAWRHLVEEVQKEGKGNGTEQVLKDFDGFTDEQVFFIAFGQTWCTVPDDVQTEYLIHNDPHAPNPVRVMGTLKNSPDFAKAFKCSAGMAYNPNNYKNRCYLY